VCRRALFIYCGAWAAVARCGAHSGSQVLDHCALPLPAAPRWCPYTQAIACVGARCASQVLVRGAWADVRGAARCLSQVLGRGAQVVARGAAALSQQEENNSADVQRNRINCTRVQR
jgi:hypothetical protein